MIQEIIPDKQTVLSCLQKKTYYVDFYQREYVWSKSTVEILLRDIFYAFELSYNEHKDEEITEEVLELYNWYYLNVFITNKVDGKTYIVDGQQRLTTLTLIATKLYNMAIDDNQKDILKECIYTKDMFKGNVFCIDNEKRKDVMECILNNNVYNQPFKNKTEETLVDRYNDISKYFDDKNYSDEKLKTFIFYFLRRLVLVELTIQKDDTPMVFEVINDRGENLKPFEILKGKMIGLLNKTETDIYSKKWDEAISCLTDIEDNFFIDYIKSRFIFKKNTVQEHFVMNAYHRYLFDYNSIANTLCFRRTDKKHIDNIKKFINNDLEYYSKLYEKLMNSENEFVCYTRDINGLSGQYQNIMAACTQNDPLEDLKIEIIAKETDRLWVLLNLNNIYDSNEFQEISYKLNELLRGKDVSEYRSIYNKLIIDCIKDKYNTNSDVTLLDYKSFLTKNYTNTNRRFLRYFFARIEYYLCQNTNLQMQKDVNYISTRTGPKGGYHIEHILSHNDINRGFFDSEEEFENDRNLLGGLLLLKGLDNISSGNEIYEDKLRTYSNSLLWGHSLCEDFYHANKDFEKFNNELTQDKGICFKSYAIFDKTALDERSRLLFQLVKIIWEVE